MHVLLRSLRALSKTNNMRSDARNDVGPSQKGRVDELLTFGFVFSPAVCVFSAAMVGEIYHIVRILSVVNTRTASRPN